jgi:predicted metalloprotease
MRWRGRQGSVNVEDRRGMRIGRGAPIGCGGLIIVLVVSWLMGADPMQLLMMLQGGGDQGTSTGVESPASAPNDEMSQFVSVVLRDTEQTWQSVFQSHGQRYEEPTLVTFTEAVESACGISSAAVGPFYCPRDHKVYLDTSFFAELSDRFGAPGDFAAAYVIAHEVGHHVQTLLGIAEEAQGRGRSNELSVRFELQADCLAGVWGYYANRDHGLIEPGDFEEGLRAAAAIGDDRLQRLGQGYVQPESWTHGSSEQRSEWLRRGLTSGDPTACDTFR